MITKEHILSTLKSNRKKLLELGVIQVGLFGSYVRNEQNETSDIDILIDFDSKKEKFDNYMAAYDYLEDLFEFKKVEVVTKNGLSPYIGKRILKEVHYV